MSVPVAPNIEVTDGHLQELVGKRNLYVCKLWKERGNFCKACKSRKKCTEANNLKSLKYREQTAGVFSSKKVYILLLRKKVARLKKVAGASTFYVPWERLLEQVEPLFLPVSPIPLSPIESPAQTTQRYSSDGTAPIVNTPTTSLGEYTQQRAVSLNEQVAISPPADDPKPPVDHQPPVNDQPNSSQAPTFVTIQLPLTLPLQRTPPAPAPPPSPIPLSPIPSCHSSASSPPLTRKRRHPDTTKEDPQVPKLGKRRFVTPLIKPTFYDFDLALQYTQPQLFKVMRSKAPEAGFGLYFNGSCKEGELLTGYGGDRKDITKGADSHYSAKIGTSKYAMDATKLSNAAKKGKYDSKYPLGHMVNRPLVKGRANCKFAVRNGVLYIAARKAIDTCGEWMELYVPYNDKRV